MNAGSWQDPGGARRDSLLQPVVVDGEQVALRRDSAVQILAFWIDQDGSDAPDRVPPGADVIDIGVWHNNVF